MAENSKIEWTDHTFNPWMGCTAVSPACDHCYAEAQTALFKQVEWGAKAPRKRTSAAYWKKPFVWNRKAEKAGKRAKVFCASFADVFDNHKSILPEWRTDLWALIRATPWLDWFLLTKRPQNFAKFLPNDWRDGYANVWLGCTAENQPEYDRRKDILIKIPAAFRFLSVEPMLGPIDLLIPPILTHGSPRPIDYETMSYAEIQKAAENVARAELLAREDLIDWVICGGESGFNARPMHPDWARSLRDQCVSVGVPFFFKQWGEWLPAEFGPAPDINFQDGSWMDANLLPDIDCADNWCEDWFDDDFDGHCLFKRVGKKTAGHLLDGVEHREMPESAGV